MIIRRTIEGKWARRERLKDVFRDLKSSGREDLIYGRFLLILYLLTGKAFLRPVIITSFTPTVLQKELIEIADKRSILEQFAAGNYTAFRGLFMRYHPKVYHFMLGLVKFESGAEDLAQEIFLRLQAHRNRFAEVRTFGFYPCVLAEHTTFNYIKSRRADLVSLESVSKEDEGRSVPYGDLVAKDSRLLMDMIVETMPPQRRTIHRMSHGERLSNTGVAENLQLSKKTMEKHLDLALGGLRNVVLTFLLVMIC